ncbi:MAG: IgGFc-binding protein, partial [Thermoplasmata archaeon]|nr:IgGFc-binding protein [Thermoplasmata archaeon]
DENDLSGSLVYATQPVQVLAGRACAFQPDPVAACDNLESSVLPAETLGKDYVVTVPTSPHQRVIGHIVRFYGNVDGTTLTYSPSQPPGCPSTLNAGEVAECTGTPNCATGENESQDAGSSSISISCVTQTFEVTGTHEFAVSSFMLGGSAVDPNSSVGEGDPSMSPMVAVEQYRSRYIFLAPTDYDESYADVVLPTGATITLDGAPLPATPSPTNATWSVARVTLGPGQDGAHLMVGSKPFGVQVIGYGSYTSYQYPAGLDLALIAAPPPPPTAK